MDLTAIQGILSNAFGNLNIWQIITGLIGGSLLMVLKDVIGEFIIIKLWPEKYIKVIYDKVEWFDNNILDKLPERTKKALQSKITSVLNTIKDQINDD